MWTRQFGTAADDLISGVAVHSSGVYVAGYTSGTFPGAPGGSGADVYIARLAPDTGNPVWVRQFGVRGSMTDIAGVDVDSTGVYVAEMHSTGDVNVPQAHLRRYDFDGNVIGRARSPTPTGTFSPSVPSRCIPRACTLRGRFKRGSSASRSAAGTAQARTSWACCESTMSRGTSGGREKSREGLTGDKAPRSPEARGCACPTRECSSAEPVGPVRRATPGRDPVGHERVPDEVRAFLRSARRLREDVRLRRQRHLDAPVRQPPLRHRPRSRRRSATASTLSGIRPAGSTRARHSSASGTPSSRR